MLDIPPDLPPQYAPVVIAQTAQAQSNAGNSERAIGICHAIGNPALVPTPNSYSAVNSLGNPAEWVKHYYKQHEKRQIDGPARVTILQDPEHGELKESVQSGEPRGNYWYFPAQGYLGQDQATFLVEIGSLKVKVIYFFKVVPVVDYKTEEEICPPPSIWLISMVPSVPHQVLACGYQESHNTSLNLTRGAGAPLAG